MSVNGHASHGMSGNMTDRMNFRVSVHGNENNGVNAQKQL